MTAAGSGSGRGDDGARFADDARRYRLTDRIATGGMGEVWRAQDSVLDRTVAVKVLKDEYADDATFRTRFEGEARHAGALHHPGIASVFDFGQEHSTGQPRPYLVMEYVDGRPLSALLRPDAPMDPRVVQDLVGQAAEALAAAHAKGIVHRDVKPANLLVTPDRRVKITDFGIARAAEGMALTETGQVLGTPHYLSPEQARGDRATSSSDLYSLGVVAFECLAGRRPFTGDSPVTTALAHLRDPVPELPSSVPADLAAVVRRALAKDPDERFGSAAEMAAALRDPAGAVAAGVAGTAGPPTTPDAAPGDEDGTPATAVLPAAAGAAGAAGAAAAMARTSGADTRREDETRPGTAATADDGGRRSGSPPWLPVLLGLLVVLLVALLLWLLLREDPEESASPTAPTSSAPATSDEPAEEATSAEPQPTEEATPTEEEPETFDLDESAYLGRDVKDVEKELRALGLTVESVELENDGSRPEGTVDDVSPTEGLAEGDTVTVSYWGKAAEDPPGEGGPGPGNGNGNGPGGGNGNGDDDD